MKGEGCKNTYWNPREKVKLDLHDSKIKHGYKIKVDIVWKPENKVISTDEYYYS